MANVCQWWQTFHGFGVGFYLFMGRVSLGLYLLVFRGFVVCLGCGFILVLAECDWQNEGDPVSKYNLKDIIIDWRHNSCPATYHTDIAQV